MGGANREAIDRLAIRSNGDSDVDELGDEALIDAVIRRAARGLQGDDLDMAIRLAEETGDRRSRARVGEGGQRDDRIAVHLIQDVKGDS